MATKLRIRIFTTLEFALYFAANRLENPKLFSSEVIDNHRVKYPTFASIPTCKHCGLKASFVAAEMDHEGNISYGTYGVKKGKEVLMTIDHIKAKCLGGSRRSLSNQQILCYNCNQQKGALEHRMVRSMRGMVRNG